MVNNKYFNKYSNVESKDKIESCGLKLQFPRFLNLGGWFRFKFNTVKFAIPDLRKHKRIINKNMVSKRTKKQQFSDNLNKENKTFECERHVSATPVPSSVYGWNYNEEHYIVENLFFSGPN